MSVSKDIRLRVIGETKKFKEEMEKLPDITKRQAAAAAKKFATEMIRGEREAAGAALKAATSASKGGSALGGAFRRAGGDLRRMGALLGPVARQASGLFGAFGSVTTVLGPAGLAVAAFGAAALGAGLGAMKLGAWAMDAARNAHELEQELRPFVEHGLLPDRVSDQLERAGAGLDAVDTVGKALSVTFADEMAPAILNGTTLVVAFGLAVRDLMDDVAEDLERFTAWHEELSAPARVALGIATAGTSDLVSALGHLNRAWDTGAESTGGYLAQARDLIGVQDQVNDGLHRGKKEAEDFAKAMQAGDDLLGIYADSTRDLRSQESLIAEDLAKTTNRIQELAQASGDTELAQQALAASQAKAARDTLDVWIQRGEDLTRGIDGDVQEAARILTQFSKDMETALNAPAEALKARNQKILGGITQSLDVAQSGLSLMSASMDASVQTATDNVSRLQQQLAAGEDFYTDAQKRALKDRIKAQKHAAIEEFNAAKTAKAAEAAASTALAAINAISQSPPPSPFGIAGALLATAAGAKAQQAINSQHLSLYSGGWPEGRAPDEVPTTMHRDEAVLSRQGRRAIGDDAIRRANAGQSAAPVRVVAIHQYRHETFNRFIRDGLRMGGPLPQAINQGKILGHRTNRKGS